jgi:hypothetical protein
VKIIVSKCRNIIFATEPSEKRIEEIGGVLPRFALMNITLKLVQIDNGFLLNICSHITGVVV